MQRPCCAARSTARKMEILPRKIKPFVSVYNILASFSDLTNPLVQYSVYVENIILTSSSFPAGFHHLYSSLENLH